MTTSNKISLFIGGFAIVAALVAGFLLWAWHLTQTDIEQAKPYVTYSKLLYAAEVCERYKAQYGVWPTNFVQLSEGRPEFGDPLDKDAWGRQFMFIPFSPVREYGSLLSLGRDGKPGGIGPDRDLEIRFPTAPNAERNKEEGVGLKPPRFNP